MYSHEKVIVKSMKYILTEPGAKYIGNIHREGMGENIIAVGLYYPTVSKQLNGSELELTVITDSDPYYHDYSNRPNKELYKFTINQGTMIAFSNECYHKLVSLEYKTTENNKNNSNKHDDETSFDPLHRTIIAFFLVSPNNDIIMNNNGNNINLYYNTQYIINYWWRHGMDSKKYDNYKISWMMDIVTSMICGDYDFIYDTRDKFRIEKGKGIKGPPKRRRYVCTMEGGTPM